jgi:hypothetical protein
MNWLNRRVLRIAACSAIGVLTAGITTFAADPKPDAPKTSAAAPAKPNAPAEPAGMTPLFNGKDLDGWEGNPQLWRFENGEVIGQTTVEKQTKGNTFLIWKGGELKDFELRGSFKITGGNSGIQYRSKRIEAKPAAPAKPKAANAKPGDAAQPAAAKPDAAAAPKVEPLENIWVVGGYQAEIAGLAGKDGFIYHERGPGRGYADQKNYLCRVGDKVVIDETGKANAVGQLSGGKNAIAATYKTGDWNDYIIIAKGNHIEQYLNGVQAVDLTDNDEKNRMMSGILALQIHAGNPMQVEFKNLRLKQLEATEKGK